MAFENQIRVDQHLIRARVLEDGETVEVRLFQAPVSETPAAGWTVTVAGAPVAVSAAEIDEDEPLVRLSIPPVVGGKAVTLSYAPASGSIMGDDFELIAFTDRPVANFSALNPPELLSVTVSADGLTVTWVFSETMTGDPTTGFSLTADGDPVTLTGGVLADDTVTFTAAAPIYAGQVVLASYDSGTGDMAGYADVLATVSAEPATNDSEDLPNPNLVSATIDATGRSLALVFDDTLTAASSAGITMAGTEVTGASYAGSTLTLAIRQVFSGASITITYDSGSGTIAGPGGDVESFGPTAVTNNSTHTGTWAAVGNSASFPGGTTTVTRLGADALSGTDIVIVDDVSDAVRVSRYSAPNWAALGSAYSVSGLTMPAVCALDATTVAAFKSNATAGLFTLSWNGSTFSTAGSQLNITGANQGMALCRLSATRVLLANSQADTLQAYDWNGSSWAAVGNSLSVGGINGVVHLAALTSTLVAMADAGSNAINLYSFNGTDWSLVAGSTLAADTVLGVTTTYPCVCALNSTDIVIGSEKGKIQAMRWNGSAWATAGSSYTVPNASSAGTGALVNLGSNEVAYMRASTTNSFLRRLVWQ